MDDTRVVNAIVLRTVNYRDYDRMLTLFTREEGMLSAAARGAHRQRSPLAAASTQFCTGEYLLLEKNGKYQVNNCMLDEAYYPLREDALRLAFASALTQVCEEIVQPAQPAPELYDTLLRALAHLAYAPSLPPENTALPFLLRAMVLSGHGAMLTRCAVCGGRIQDARFDELAGGVICARHADRPLPVITAADMAMLRACVQGAFAPVAGNAARLFAIAAQFVRAQLERDFDALTFAQRLGAPEPFNVIPPDGN